MTIAAGIDVGTGAVKAALFRVEGEKAGWLSRATLRIRQRDPTELARIVSTLPQGTWELVLHPGYDDDALRAAGTRLRESREIELQLLTSAQTRDLLDRTGIRLISYRDL